MFVPGTAICMLSNASTGAKVWSYFSGQTDDAVSSPTVVNGVVYFSSYEDREVRALNASTGALLWSYTTGNFVVSSPAVANGVVYIGSDDGNLYALNANTGAFLWSYTTGGPVTSSAAVGNGIVYIGSWDGNVYALNANTGARVWSYTTKPGWQVQSSPAVANGVVYVGDNDSSIYALNASTGSLLWSYATGNDVQSSPAVANGVVYVGSWDGKVYALNASTGAKLWSYTLGGLATPSPAVVGGVLYMSSLNHVYAFGPGRTADLYLRIQPTPTAVHQGDLLTYAFPVWNLGPGVATQEVLNTQVPAGTTFDYIRISGTPGLGTCTTPPYQGTGQIICQENSSMAPNTTWTVRMTVRVTAPSSTVITENAATMADTTDPNLANNTATVSTTVQ
jgi:outer membrane protein assembly factor BamB